MLDHTTTTTDETLLNHPLFDEQIKLEEEMRTAGIIRFREQMEKQMKDGVGSQTRPGVRLVERSHAKMVEAIEAFVAEAESGKAGRRHTAIGFIRKLDVDMVANITARCCLDQALLMPSLTKLSMAHCLLHDPRQLWHSRCQCGRSGSIPAGRVRHNVCTSGLLTQVQD